MMTKLMITLAATAAAVAGGSGMIAAPAAAQDRISEIIVYGNDPCPRSTDDEVVVCARRPEAERYRLPERYRPSGPPQVRESRANKATALETVGATGTFSCSPVGPGGFTGCLNQVINQARRERQEEAAGQTPPEE
jgi:hypothetical protein